MDKVFKKFIILSLALLCKPHLFSQKMYADISAGYATSIASQVIATQTNYQLTEISEKSIRGSFGKGSMIHVRLGYLLKSNLSVEIGTSFLNGVEYEGYYVKDTSFEQATRVSARMLRLHPAIRFTLSEKKFSPYIKLGAVIRIAGNIASKNTYYDVQESMRYVTEWRYTKGFSMGAFTSMGVLYKFKERVHLFGELALNIQTWAPKKGDIVKYSINDVDMTNTLSSGQKNIHFEDSYTVQRKDYSTYIPTQQLRQYYPFSSISLNVGLSFFIDRKKQ